jgi:predicted ATPase/class 3 adenylate cyclase
VVDVDELPTGVVTFLFTDVQGSTRLLEQLGDRYRAVKDGHDVIVRSAIVDHGGRVVDTAGDGFFAVFPSPRRAVDAAARVQRELAAGSWPDDVPVLVRIGVHTGDGVLDDSGYVGLDVHRAARISAAAHGGQVLISDATRALVADALPDGARLEDLGVHRLKDLTRPERLYRLTLDGLAHDSRPPRTIDAPRGNLPVRLTGFIGRTDQVAQVRELVRDHRLVTLTGPGGTGKTRLALQVAAELAPGCADGAFFVDLSPVRDPGLLPTAVAASLALVEQPGRPAADVVTEHLRNTDLLLVLDNFEQVSDAAPFVEDVLAAAPGLRVLVTSRVPLHVYGEQEFAVPPLELPDTRQGVDLDAVGRSEAVALFVQRASAAVAGFRLTEENAGAVAGITARLDGLPLAIELAASRVKMLPPQRLLTRLDRRLPLLTAAGRNVPERQRTLRAAIDWSYDLLPGTAQRLFRRMAVFAGGADLAAIEAVADPDGRLGDILDLLTTLVDANLVRRLDDSGDEARFGMLETIREYALEQLSLSDEQPDLRRRHADHWVEMAERATGASGPDQLERIRLLDGEVDNLRAALDWTVHAQEAALGLRLAVALEDYWRLGSHVREGVHRLAELLALDAPTTNPRLRARALSVLSSLHGWIDDPDQMVAAAEQALAIYRRLDDAAGIAEATGSIGWAQLQMGRLEPARIHLTEAIDAFRDLGDRERAATAMPALGIIAQFEGDLSEARRRFEAAADALRGVDDQFMVSMTDFMIGGVDKVEGNLRAAEQRYDAGLSGYLRIDNAMGISWGLYSFADLALQCGQPARALRLVGASERLRGGTALPTLITATLGDVGRRAREAIDADADEIYRQGHDLGMEEAVAYARDRRPDDDAGDDDVSRR